MGDQPDEQESARPEDLTDRLGTMDKRSAPAGGLSPAPDEASEVADGPGMTSTLPMPQADLEATCASGRGPLTDDVSGLSATRDFADPGGGQTLAHNGVPRRPKGDKAPLPKQIGRYFVRRLLGEGGFGLVYEAFDPELKRVVALKVPHAHLILNPADVEVYIDEARTLAGLDHPNIVPVFHAERTSDGLCVIVSKYIEGSDLSERIKHGPLPPLLAAELVTGIADALDYAHAHQTVHRDVKPRNILVDPGNKPYLTDFGLALREPEFGAGPSYTGTAAYMSPEQARGEGHLVDGRADVFSLGVVFYELLTGVRPFRGAGWIETIERIQTLEPRPPRQSQPAVPPELERVCLKALSKRVLDRYATAGEMADDLRHFCRDAQAKSVASVAQPPARARPDTDPSGVYDAVIPKGLRSFEASDADYFMWLLPGPRDRDCVPESVRFWRTRIEETSAEKTFRVGLVYGPSGCGKSSFLKAGLLPRLGGHVHKVFVESTAEGTESRLLATLLKTFPTLPAGKGLALTLAALRRGQGPSAGDKVLIVLDQFEQWLQATREPEDTELVQTLRQCDGGRVQCVLTVRVDFWMSVRRFMHALEVPLLEAHNSAALDLFNTRHARKVLTALGRAFESLPPYPGEVSKSQREFLDQAVSDLVEDGKIVPVHLSLFAEMVKDKPWTPATLKEVGGAQGVGARFLEGTFGALTAPPEHRLHQRAARAVLEALLPEHGRETKGHMRSRQELLEVSGYAHRPRDFDELIHILDAELRLLTPVDPRGSDAVADGPENALVHYQLTHDYLVPALKEWLTRKQRETARGRIRLRLAECASLWHVKHERKQLPTFWEWLDFRLFTHRGDWNRREAEMMRVATRRHALRCLSGVLIMTALGAVALDVQGRSKADALLNRLYEAEAPRVPTLLREMAPYRRWINPRLAADREPADQKSLKSLNVSLALLPSDPGQVDYLAQRLIDVDPASLLVVRESLTPYSHRVRDRLWAVLEDPSARRSQRIRAACALAAFDPDDRRWSALAPEVASLLVTDDPFGVVAWCDLLRPVRASLFTPLRTIFIAPNHPEKRYIAACALAQLFTDQPRALVDLIRVADARQLRVLADQLGPGDHLVATLLTELVDEEREPATSSDEQIERSRGRANAALALFAMGKPDSAHRLLGDLEDCGARMRLLVGASRFGVDPLDLIERFRQEPVPAARQALILCLGQYPETALSSRQRERLLPLLQGRFRDDPDPGVHSALEWVLRRWSRTEELDRIELSLAGTAPRNGQRWQVTREQHTLAIVPSPVEFTMGSPATESHRQDNESPRRVRIDRAFAIATKEVTVEQFLRFRHDHLYDVKVSPDPRCPIPQVNWFDAAQYCRWLSEQEGIAKEQWCYPSLAEIQDGCMMYPDYLTRTGYRLPTEAEWEYSCRAKTSTSRPFGEDATLIDTYAWSFSHSNDRTHPVALLMPNPLGLFDILGNLYEWCQDAMVDIRPGRDGEPRADVDSPGPIRAQGTRVIRGSAFHRDVYTVRSAYRNKTVAEDRNKFVGFRIARTWPKPSPSP